MIESNDWRLIGQEEYLKGIALKWKQFELGFPGYDHDHCEFCWRKIAYLDMPDSDRYGYATDDNKRWICEECFEDFKDMFEWKVD